MSESNVKVGDKIKVVCHGCGARYRVSSEKVQGRRFRATCKRCGGIIVARCTSAFTVLPEDGGQRTGSITMEKSEVIQRDAQEQAWYAVIEQKPHGPLSDGQLRQYFATGQVTGRTYLWRSGDPQWRRLGDVPQFSDLLAEEPTTAYEPGEMPGAGDGRGEDAAQGLADAYAGHEPTTNWSEDGAEDLIGGQQPHGAVAWPEGEDLAGQGDDEEATSADTRVHTPEGPLLTPAEDPYEEAVPTDEPTHYRYPAPRAQAAPVGYDARQGRASNLPAKPTLHGWDDPGLPPGQEPQPLQVPRVEPRKAWLPAPTGIPRHITGNLPQVDRGAMADPGPLFTRPMPRGAPPAAPPASLGPDTDHAALSLSSLAPLDPLTSDDSIPLITPGPILEESSLEAPPATAQLSPPATSLPPPTPAPALADARRINKATEFWTTGKIALVAAVGGGLMVALAMMFGVYLARPGKEEAKDQAKAVALAKVAPVGQINASGKPAKPAAKPRSTPATEARAAKPQPAAPAPAPSTAPAPDKASEPAVAPATEAQQASEPGQQPGPPAKAAKVEPEKPAPAPAKARPPKKKVAAKPRPRKRPPRRRRRASSDVDALLMGANTTRRRRKPRSSSNSGADDILAASTRRRKPRSSSNSGADDILAASTRRRKPAASSVRTLPRHPTKGQVKSTMRRAMPRVASCYEKYHQSGVIKVSMRVRPDGSADGRVVGTFAGTATAFCVLAGVNKLRFPKFSGDAFSFTYPFRLK